MSDTPEQVNEGNNTPQITAELAEKMRAEGYGWLLEETEGAADISLDNLTEEQLAEIPDWLKEDVGSSTDNLNTVEGEEVEEFKRSLQEDLRVYGERYARRASQLEALKVTDPELGSEEAAKIKRAMSNIKAFALRYRFALNLLDKGKVEEAKNFIRSPEKVKISKVIAAVQNI